MKTMMTLLILLSTQAFAANYSYYEKVLRDSESLKGDVEVTKVTAQGSRDFVEVDVTRHGETRASWCVIEEGVVLQCMDNWFDESIAH